MKVSVLLSPEVRGALLAGSFTRFWRFTIEQPSRFVLSLIGFRACLLAVAGRGNAVCYLLRWLLKSGGVLNLFAAEVCSCDESNMNHRFIFGQVLKVHIFSLRTCLVEISALCFRGLPLRVVSI